MKHTYPEPQEEPAGEVGRTQNHTPVERPPTPTKATADPQAVKSTIAKSHIYRWTPTDGGVLSEHSRNSVKGSDVSTDGLARRGDSLTALGKVTSEGLRDTSRSTCTQTHTGRHTPFGAHARENISTQATPQARRCFRNF